MSLVFLRWTLKKGAESGWGDGGHLIQRHLQEFTGDDLESSARVDTEPKHQLKL